MTIRSCSQLKSILLYFLYVSQQCNSEFESLARDTSINGIFFQKNFRYGNNNQSHGAKESLEKLVSIAFTWYNKDGKGSDQVFFTIFWNHNKNKLKELTLTLVASNADFSKIS